MFSKFIWATVIQKYEEKELWNLGMGVAFYYDLKYNR